MAAKALPPAEYLRQCFDYDAETGVLTWRERPREHFSTEHAWLIFNGQRAGTQAGSLIRLDDSPRIAVSVDHLSYPAHRIIWKLDRGCDPVGLIDHEDGDGTNNRRSNLRDATNSQNAANSRARRSGTSKGAYWDANRKKWLSQITHMGRAINLGRFDTQQEAHAAYRKKAEELFGEFAKFGGSE